MSISFLLRLADQPLSDRRIAGQVEVVHTGEQATVRTSEELVAFLYAHASASPRQQETPSEADWAPPA